MNGIGNFKKYKKIALDTSIFVYQIGKISPYYPITFEIFKNVEEGQQCITTTITVTEFLVKPDKLKEEDLIRKHEDMLKYYPNLRIFPVEWDLTRLASKIRAKYNFKTPDAIQLALAVSEKADVFITNDRNMKAFKEVKVLALSDFV